MLAVWTDDEKQSAVINLRSRIARARQSSPSASRRASEALEAGNEGWRPRALQRANALAEQTGHEAAQKLIRKLADIDDKGTLRLKKNVDKMDVKELDTRSTRTARTEGERVT